MIKDFDEIIKNILHTDILPSQKDGDLINYYKVDLLRGYLENLRISNEINRYVLHLVEDDLHYEIWFDVMGYEYLEGEVNLNN